MSGKQIQNLFENIYKIEYIGNNTYGENNLTSIVFPTTIEILLFSIIPTGQKQYYQVSPIITKNLSSDWKGFYFYDPIGTNGTSAHIFYIKKNQTSTQFDIYSTENSKFQFNYSFNVFYGLSKNNDVSITNNFFLITESGTFTVPYTGQYYLELYGGGRGGYEQSVGSYDGKVTGATSVQSYSNISLQKDSIISVTIGDGGKRGYQYTSSSTASTDGGRTIFGNYSVNGRNRAYSSTYTPSGQGNLGTSGIQMSSYQSIAQVNYSKGILAAFDYGYSTIYDGAKGCVCLKYLRE